MATQTFSIKLTANGKEVIELQNALKEKANEYEKQLDEINQKLKDRKKLTEEEIADLEKQSNSLAAKIKALGTAVEENITKLRTVDDVLKNLAGSSGSELGKALRGLGQKFKQVSDQTLKAGETMEGKLIEIKEKTIEVRHEMAKRDGIDAMKRAQATMQDLVNTPTDKLKMGLDSIEKKLLTMSDAEKQAADGMTLLNARSRYKAQLAVNEYGRAGTADIAKMNADQLRAEQARLKSAYSATEGAKGYETISQEYLNRLQQVNQLIKDRTTLEQNADRQRRESMTAMEREKESLNTVNKVLQGQSVSVKDLESALDFYQKKLKEVKGVDDFYTKDTLENIRLIKEARDKLNNIDVHSIAKSPNDYSLNEMREASRVAKERFADMKPSDQGYQQMKEDIIALDAAVSAYTPKVEKLAQAEAQAAQAAEIIGRANRNEKVTFEELREAEKALTEQIKGLEGINLPWEDQDKLLKTKASLEDIQEIMSRMTLETFPFDSLENISTERLEQALKQLEEDEKRLAETDADTAKQIAQNKRKVQEQINKNRRAVQDYENAEKVAANTGKHSITELQQAYDTLKQKLMGLSTGQKKEISETRAMMKKLKQAIDDTTGSVSKQNSIWQTAVRNITAYVGVFGAFNFIKNKLQEVIRGSAELSDQMAKVRMVSGLAMNDIEELTRRLAKMDTRTTLQELSEISYIGSKLGFGEMGIQGLEEFTRAANQVNVALKEDLGNEALTALSKITENMGLIKKMGVEQAMLATSSAMFKLYTTSTAAAGPIVEVTRRLAPMAQISGFATHEILALASASDALMQSEEVAGTAMSKFMMAMQNNHNVIEKTLGMTEGSIASMMKSGKSMEAFLTILDKMSGKNVTELSNVWKLLGSEGDRLIRVILSMANHTDLVRKHLDTASKSFKEATAVTEEYNIQQETAMAYIQRADNKLRNAFINPDSSLAVKEMTKAWYDFVKGITDSETALSGIKLSVQSLLLVLRALIALIPMITFGALAKGAMLLYEKLMLTKVATDGLTMSWKKMDAATKSNWIGLIVGSLVQAVYWLKEFSSATSDAEKEQKKLSAAIEGMHEKVDNEIGNLSRLKKQIDDTNISQEDRNKLLSKVRSDYDIYLNYLGVEIKTVDELAKHYDALTKVMRQRFAYQEREDYKRDVMGGEEGLRMKRRKAGSELVKKGNALGLNLDLDAEIIPMLESGKSWQEIYKKVNPQGKGKSKTYKGAYSSGIDTDYATTFDKYLMNFVNAWQAERKKEDEINAAFASEIGDFDYDKWLRTQVKGEFKVEPPEGGGGGKGGSELKNKFKTAKENAEGLIAKIDEWYNLQDAVINDYAASGKISEKEAEEALKAMKVARNTALEKARLAVASGDDAEWKKFYTDQMSKMMIDHGEWSSLLFEEITKVDVKTLHDFLATFDGSEGMKRLDASGFFDAMRKKAAGNKKEVTEELAKAREELDKLLLKYDYFSQASLQFAKNLTQIGALGVTAEQMAKDMEGVPDAKQTQEAAQSMLAAVIRQGASVYAIDPGDAKAVADMLRQATASAMTEADYLAGKTSGEQAKWFDLFPALKDWMDNPEQHKKELEDVFNVMLIAEQDYYQKRKQSYETEKREQENRFRAAGFTDQEEQQQTALSNLAKQKDAGIGATFMEQQGLGSIANDPEVMAIQNRIYWRNEEVKAAEARLQALKAMQEQELANAEQSGATMAELDRIRSEQAAQRMGLEDLLHKKQTELFEQQVNLTTQVAQELQKRVQTINNLTKPIQDAANNVGKKLGDMIRGAEEDSITWNEIWKSMAVAVGESVIDMMAAYAQNLLMEKAMNTQHKQEAISKATVDVAAGTASAAAKTLGTLGWWGMALIPVMAALLKGLLNEALASDKKSEAATKATDTTPKTKIVSGMLTYDRGNTDSVLGGSPAKKKRRYLGDDGRVYLAEESPSPKDGLVTRPIATTVQGQPALVAERGPEIVIGRETTRAIMLNEPELIRYIANYDRAGGHAAYSALRAYDSGTVPATVHSPAVLGGTASGSPAENAPVPDASPAGNESDLRQFLSQLIPLMQRMSYQLDNPVAPEIAMYDSGGKKGLHTKMKEANKFMAQYSR